jgi:hypothetical protein
LWKTEVGIERLEVRDVVDDQVGAVDDILHAAPAPFSALQSTETAIMPILARSC